jgi:hypothetical protein
MMNADDNWAASAARQIKTELVNFVHQDPNLQHNVSWIVANVHEARIATIIATFAEPLVALLRDARREHYHCDDSWYCCGKCTHSDHIYRVEGEWQEGDEYPLSEGFAGRVKGRCTCGADAWNARVGAALAGAEVDPGAANGGRVRS